MERPLTTLRFLAGLLAPGGVLVLATWAVQREDVVQSAAAPYAAYFCFGALLAGVLLSWYHDQSRLLCAAVAIVLTWERCSAVAAGLVKERVCHGSPSSRLPSGHSRS